jgi:hypothetical protein
MPRDLMATNKFNPFALEIYEQPLRNKEPVSSNWHRFVIQSFFTLLSVNIHGGKIKKHGQPSKSEDTYDDLKNGQF